MRKHVGVTFLRRLWSCRRKVCRKRLLLFDVTGTVWGDLSRSEDCMRCTKSREMGSEGRVLPVMVKFVDVSLGLHFES